MAPTQILAEQHYAVLQWLEPLGVRSLCMRLRGGRSAPLPLFANAEQSSGRRRGIDQSRCVETTQPAHETRALPNRTAGHHRTHALLYESVTFSNLGLA
jgi:RecG-like helicase